eukprot:150332_1
MTNTFTVHAINHPVSMPRNVSPHERRRSAFRVFRGEKRQFSNSTSVSPEKHVWSQCSKRSRLDSDDVGESAIANVLVTLGQNGTKKEGRNHCNSKVSRHRKYIQSDQNFNLIKPDADLPKKSSLSQKIFDASHIGSTWDSSSPPDSICTLPRSRSEPKFSLESPCHESMLPPLQSLPPPNTPCSSIDQPFSSPVPSLFQVMSDQSWSPGGMSIQSPGFGSSPVPFGVSMHCDIETQVAMSTSMATSFHPHSDSPTPLQPFNMWFHPLLAPPGINPGFGQWPAVPTGISGLPVPGISLPPLPHSLGGDILGSLNMGDYEAGVRRMNSCSPNNFESNSFESAVCSCDPMQSPVPGLQFFPDQACIPDQVCISDQARIPEQSCILDQARIPAQACIPAVQCPPEPAPILMSRTIFKAQRRQTSRMHQPISRRSRPKFLESPPKNPESRLTNLKSRIMNQESDSDSPRLRKRVRIRSAERAQLAYVGLMYARDGPSKWAWIRLWRNEKGMRFYDCVCNCRKPVQDLNKLKSHAERHTEALPSEVLNTPETYRPPIDFHEVNPN